MVTVSDKTDIKRTKIKGHYIMAKGFMQQEELTLTNLNIDAPKTGTSRFIKQVFKDLERDIESHTIIVGDFNTPLSRLEQ